jgi:biopolymer transport protein ExbD
MAGRVTTGFSDDDEGLMSDINVTPMVDVILVLLIVFMITVPAIVGTAPVKIDLPETKSVPAPSEQLQLAFALKRGATGELELYLNDQKTDEAGVRKQFKEHPPTPDQQVSLSADKDIAYGQVMKIVDLLESLGLKKLSLPTRHVE